MGRIPRHATVISILTGSWHRALEQSCVIGPGSYVTNRMSYVSECPVSGRVDAQVGWRFSSSSSSSSRSRSRSRSSSRSSST